ncbi:MAG TPA: patatin family protein [Candidatus Avacidaminococcus intestinavium]|uniref:Patatin family protein n=1 Tax=Candidatus Avacidaminococcus intestinavium TaxID=2840684 RepID=A0A9D1MQI6_9FIRM|nr:patatin family protein [Candidatus Avacidaminococcus intestinavium]
MTMLKDIALVLEGGGMRGMFSAGVFEAFMQKNIDFPYATAVSAGACNIASYLSKQPFRTKKIIEDYVADARYCSMRNLFLKGSMFDFDFILKEIPQKLLPFDYTAFNASPCNLQVGATDCQSGTAVWFKKEDMGLDFTPLRASASLPFISPIVNFNGYKLLDGGLIAPIPIDKALADGYKKLVVVLTRNEGYRNTESYSEWILKLRYPQYPRMIATLLQRSINYNRQLALVEQLEKEGKAVVIRPQTPLTIKRMDRKPPELIKLHDHGTECALEALPAILKLANH